MNILYTKKADPYSVRMKEFLKRIGVEFEEKPAGVHDFPIPQLVIDGKPVGNYEELTSAYLKGEFNNLVGKTN